GLEERRALGSTGSPGSIESLETPAEAALDQRTQPLRVVREARHVRPLRELAHQLGGARAHGLEARAGHVAPPARAARSLRRRRLAVGLLLLAIGCAVAGRWAAAPNGKREA